MSKSHPNTLPQLDVDELNQAFETADVQRICAAIRHAVHSYNIADIARNAGLSRPSIYRAFSGGQAAPNVTTMLGVLHAMGLQLKVAPRGGGPIARASGSHRPRSAVR